LNIVYYFHIRANARSSGPMPTAQLWPRLHQTVYSKEVSPDLSTFRTVFRDTFRSRAISLIVPNRGIELLEIAILR
jgi:hypothetical protein